MQRPLPTTPLVSAMLFLSGASAAIFEMLWFRQASLTFGNSVWATTLVLCSFMGGLALGNGLAYRSGYRVDRPVKLYAILELIIGVSGLALVFLLPRLSGLFAPLFRPLLELPWLLNPLRLLFALLLMIAPATAMGATLPFMVRAVTANDAPFGRMLGLLYGLNTLGAVVGALVAEGLLVGWLGMLGSGLFAASLNFVAAGLATWVFRGTPAPLAPEPPAPERLSFDARRILFAAFLCGAILLALEVVWFRFLLLFVMNTSSALALLLAVILAGIGLGGLAGSIWLRRSGSALARVPLLALASGILVVSSYTVLESGVFAAPVGLSGDALRIALLGVPLMFPVSFLSGMLFTMLGTAAHQELHSSTRAAGLLTLANTVGSMLGAVAGGFLLLPNVGMEGSFFLLALAYGVVAGSVLKASEGRVGRPVLMGLGVAYALRLALFPFGLMERHYLPLPASLYNGDGSRVVAAREGLTETVLYMEKEWMGRPLYYRMLTNGFSMSGTHTFGRRYMKLFVYLPVALRPEPKSALLISYGVGSTAKALTDTRSLERIDVVDISRDVLEMNDVVYPDPATHPLKDPRVRVHVEDGRYFLLTTEQRFDVITAEPPPPKNAGIVNLYSREYFALLRDRLTEGGVASYWLPVHDLQEQDAKAIVAAFCAAFDDCSLWNGSGLDWVLLGTRGAGPVTEPQLARQWQDPAVLPELLALGFEGPEQLGALFLGDASFLKQLTKGVEPLVDDRPKRLTDGTSPEATLQGFASHVALMDAAAARVRFEESEWVRKIWPEALRARSGPAFRVQQELNDRLLPDHFNQSFVLDYARLHRVLTLTPYRTLPLWMLGSTRDEQHIVHEVAEGLRDPHFSLRLGTEALANRDYEKAIRQLESLSELWAAEAAIARLRAYALCMAGRIDQARELDRKWHARGLAPSGDDAFWNWLRKTFFG